MHLKIKKKGATDFCNPFVLPVSDLPINQSGIDSLRLFIV